MKLLLVEDDTQVAVALDRPSTVVRTLSRPSSASSTRSWIRAGTGGLKAGLIASTIRSRPLLVPTVHTLVLDEPAGRLAGVLRLFEALLPRRSDRLIAVSQQIADRFAGVAGAERIVVIAPASDPPEAVRPRDEVRASLGVDLEVPLMVCVARLHPQKDLPTFLRAVRHMQAQVPAVRAAIVGDGPDEAAVRALVDAVDEVYRAVGGS